MCLFSSEGFLTWAPLCLTSNLNSQTAEIHCRVVAGVDVLRGVFWCISVRLLSLHTLDNFVSYCLKMSLAIKSVYLAIVG